VCVVVVVVVVVVRRPCSRRRSPSGHRCVAAVVPVGQPDGRRSTGRHQVRQNGVGRRRDRRGRPRVRRLRGVPRAGPNPRLRSFGIRGSDRLVGGRAARVGRR